MCRSSDNVKLLRAIVFDRLRRLQEVPVSDDLKTFIKMEPHKLEKLKTSRYRLIMVTSLEDQMVDRYLMANWQTEESYNVLQIPGKTGWTPLPGGYKTFNSVFPREVLATDCSSFDWTFPEWLPPLLLQLRLDQTRKPPAWYVNALENRWAAVLKEATLRLPNGARYKQTRWGLMKSGWFRTIAENSAAQVLINALAWRRAGFRSPFPTIWTMGDDVLMEWPGESVEMFERALATTGILVKQSSCEREFAGFRIVGNTVTPLYPAKHEYLLRFVNPLQKEEIADAYTMLYALADGPMKELVSHHVAPCARITERLASAWARGLVRI